MTLRNLKQIERLTDHLPREQRIKANYALYGAVIAKKRKIKHTPQIQLQP